MKASEFIKLLKQAHDVPNCYNNHFPYNCGYYDGTKYSWDCWNLIKTILANPPWADTRVKDSYVDPATFVTGDVDGYHLLMQCTDRSKDFTQLRIPGTYLYISNSPHAGIYVGDFKYQNEIFNVVECTGAWDSKVQYTYVDEKGGRYLYKGGSKNPYSWTDFGLLPYIEYETDTQLKGIDVSYWQGSIDWAKVKADGVVFAIIRAGGSDSGRFKDSCFERNYAEARANGIKVGCYYIHGKGCTSAAAGVADAQHFLFLIGGKVFEYPCYSDFEVPSTDTKQGNTDAVIAFCETVKAAGYKTGIYASDISGFKSRLDISRLVAYDKWVARYGSKPQYALDYQLWQYSSSGSVSGINGRVDTDISYFDYSAEPTPEPITTYIYMGTDFSPVFDPEYYANKYADLQAAFGNDHAALWNHFITFGMNELRQASAEFDPRAYIDRYEDLRKVYGDNYPLYYWHYCYFGKNEGRIGS